MIALTAAGTLAIGTSTFLVIGIAVAVACAVAMEANRNGGATRTQNGRNRISSEMIREAKRSYVDGKTHIAFVGTTGAGKSSMVNSVRGLRAGRTVHGAARVGQRECTTHTTRYDDARYPNHVL
jgi:ABC-type transport system involved in cytochrome bd biosynthesis fused ATPase/permease subunit